MKSANWIPACSAQPSLQDQFVAQADSLQSEFSAALFSGMTAWLAPMATGCRSGSGSCNKSYYSFDISKKQVSSGT
jgi:hypothetical protein